MIKRALYILLIFSICGCANFQGKEEGQKIDRFGNTINEDGNIDPPSDDEIQTPSTIPPIPPDIPYEVEAWVQYYNPTTTGMEILFWIMRGYKRTDGEEKKNFFLKRRRTLPSRIIKRICF